MDFNMMAERIGIPVTILCFVAFALWRILVWVGNKVVLPVTTSHIELVNETKKNNEINAEANRINAEANQRIGNACEAQAKILQVVVDNLKK